MSEQTSCLCGCPLPAVPGGKFASRACANRYHGQQIKGTTHKSGFQRKCGFALKASAGDIARGETFTPLNQCKKFLKEHGCQKRRFN